MITSIVKRREGGACANLQMYAHKMKFAGDAAYPDGGTPGFVAELVKTLGLAIKPIECIAINCGAYKTQITETPAILLTDATWDVSDITGLTLLYKLNRGDEQTLTFGTATTRAHVAEDINAETGVRSYDDGVQVAIKTDEVGEGASFEITGGTALTALGLVAGEHVGSEDLLLRVNAIATGADAGVGDPSTDLSGTTFEVLILSE